MNASVRSRAGLLLLVAPVLGVGAAACDVSDPFEGVDLILDVPDARVEVPAGAGTLDVRSGETTSRSGQISNSSDIAQVRELRELRFDPSDFSFQAGGAGARSGAAQAAGAAPGSGTVTLAVFLNGVPVPGTPIVVTVVDGVVTQVSPSSIVIAASSVDTQALQALLEGLPPGAQPDLKNWPDMTISEVVGEINQGLAAASLPIVLVATADGDLDGSLRLHAFEFDARVVVAE